MVSVRLTSVSEVVSNVDESDVVINSILFSLLFAWDFTAVVTKYPVVDIAPATTRNFKMNFMRLAHFLGFSEPFWLLEQQPLFAKKAPAAKQSADPKQLCDIWINKFHVTQCQTQNTFEIWPSSEPYLTTWPLSDPYLTYFSSLLPPKKVAVDQPVTDPISGYSFDVDPVPELIINQQSIVFPKIEGCLLRSAYLSYFALWGFTAFNIHIVDVLHLIHPLQFKMRPNLKDNILVMIIILCEWHYFYGDFTELSISLIWLRAWEEEW